MIIITLICRTYFRNCVRLDSNAVKVFYCFKAKITTNLKKFHLYKMEFFSEQNNDDDAKDRFMTIMKNNAVLDCRIIQLTSHINSHKKELNDVNRQIEEERGISDMLRSEVEIKQSCELQARSRIQCLDKTKRLIAKLCNELGQQVSLEKRRIDETKKFQENSIKNQITKWEEYELFPCLHSIANLKPLNLLEKIECYLLMKQTRFKMIITFSMLPNSIKCDDRYETRLLHKQKIYATLPLVKEVEKEEIVSKAVQIEKMRKVHELYDLKKKLEMRNKIQEKLKQVQKEKQANLELENAELEKKYEQLQNKRLEQLKLIDSLRQEKNRLLSELKQEAESMLTKHLNRPGNVLICSSGGPLETNFEKSDVTESSPIDLPELPHLQLPQITVSSRKIRRIDMIDTTLVIPDCMSFSVSNRLSQMHSQPVNQTDRNEQKVLRNVSISQARSTHPSSRLKSEIANQHFNLINKNNNRAESFNTENSFNQYSAPNQCSIVKPLITNNNQNRFKNLENIEPMKKTADTRRDDFQHEEQMDDDCESNGDFERNRDESQNGEDMNVVLDSASLSTNFNEDDGYYSQSITSQSQSFVSQNQKFTSQNQSNPSASLQSHSSVVQSQNIQSPDHLVQSPLIGRNRRGEYQGNIPRASTALLAIPSSSLSTSLQESDETRSKYFTKRQKSNHPPVPTSLSGMNIFKSPLPPPPSAPRNKNRTSTFSSQCTPTNGTLSGSFDRNKSQKSQNFSQERQSHQEPGNDNIQEDRNLIERQQDCFMSPEMEDDMSPWMKASSPPKGMNITSPPDVPSYTESYLDILSPPQQQGGPRTLVSALGEPPRSINMFGPSSTQESTGGFSFTSKLPTPSSLFSMFK